MPAADLYRALWRHWLLILLLTALAGAAAYGYTRAQSPVYEAGALVRIQQRASEETFGLSSLELGQRLAQTYARIVSTHSMRERVAEKLEGKVSIDEISLSASPVGDIELLSILARSGEPAVAALVANATVDALRDFIKETGTLRDQIVVVDRAGQPSEPVLPRTTLTVAFAVLLALMFNAALALAREFFADRLPGVDEWESRFGRPVLATVPILNLKPYSSVVTSISEESTQTSEPVTALAAQSVSGPTRWSLQTPEVRDGGA